MKRYFIFICSFILFFNSFCLTVNAVPSYRQEILGVTKEDFDNWSDEEISRWFDLNWERFVGQTNGFFGSKEALERVRQEYYLQVDKYLVGSETYDEWVARNLGIENDNDGKPQVLMSDELSDAMYQACQKYINEYTGWMNLYSYDVKQIGATMDNNAIYKNLESAVKNKASNQLLFARVTIVDYKIFLDYFTLKYDGLIMNVLEFDSKYNAYRVRSEDTWTGLDYYFTSSGSWCDGDGKWDSFKYDEVVGHKQNRTDYDASNVYFFMHTGTPLTPNFSKGGYSSNYFLIDNGCRQYRVYKSLEEYKSYSVGTRPYFTTGKFQNYNASGDNSCILTESELNGSSVYGDVVNYIINYPGADGLTEEELRAILEEYLNKLPSGGSGGSGGSSGGSSSGGGFFDFVDGLGGLFDGILSILGKLLEYIGKAITLIVDTISNLIDTIPKNIGQLFSAMFPFLPEEFMTAIELALVLGIVSIVIKLFRG